MVKRLEQFVYKHYVSYYYYYYYYCLRDKLRSAKTAALNICESFVLSL